MSEPRTGLALPHAYPFLLLDRIVEIRPAVSAIATRNLTRDDPLLDDDGCLPPVLLAEAMAQCAGLAVLGLQASRAGVLARIDRFRSRASIRAGDQLQISMRVLRIFGATVKARGTVRVNGRVCAAGDLVVQLSGSIAGTER